MENAIPLPEIGHRWLDLTKSRFLAVTDATVVFEHQGEVAPNLISEMLTSVERHSKDLGDPITMRKRLVHVMVESMDNMHRHAMGILGEASFALLVRDRDGYRFGTGNAMPCATATLLTHRVGILNEMDPLDLKDHYMKLLSNEARSANGGAGLGLLTLARKSTRPILTSCDTFGPFTSFFTFEMRVVANSDQSEIPAA